MRSHESLTFSTSSRFLPVMISLSVARVPSLGQTLDFLKAREHVVNVP